MVVLMAALLRLVAVTDTYRMPSADRRAADPTGLPRPLAVQRELFDIPDDVAYFNCASLSPQLRASAEAAAAGLGRRARPWTISTDDWFGGAEERRALFARLAGVDPEGVALVPATSYGLAVAAANLTAHPGQRVLVLADDYPSNRYTWQRFAGRTGARLVAVERRDGQSWAEAVLGELDERAAVVAVLATHWTDGGSVDLAPIAARAREAGAALVVDASQAVGAMPLDLDAVQPDYLVTVGYKWLLGPFALGYLYVAERHRDGIPLEENWIARLGSEDFAALVDYQDRYQPGARRFDVGQRTHFETTPMAVAALRQLLDWEVPRIAATLGQVTGRIQRAVEAIGLPLTSSDRVPHMLGIGLPGQARAAVARALADAGVHAGVRGSSLRISPHLWTTDQDIERLVDALTKATTGMVAS
jgi:selenocysteine lyase/cysteine desulfurase